GQTIPLTQVGTGSDLACGQDCLFTLGAAEFHVNSTFVGGNTNTSFDLSGIGTMIMPGFDPATDGFSLIAQDPFVNAPIADVEFDFFHVCPETQGNPSVCGARPHRGCRTPRPNSRERWPSRLVATAEEGRLNGRHTTRRAFGF